MKVIWFEMSVTPAGYDAGKTGMGGWQDALEELVVSNSDIELYIAFYSEKYSQTRSRKINDRVVTYIPVNIDYSWSKKLVSKFSWNPLVDGAVDSALNIINEIKPDIIHVFGTEWPWGIVARKTEIPVVVHVQGSVIPYSVTCYPPGYSTSSVCFSCLPSFKQLVHVIKQDILQRSWMDSEKRVWDSVKYYMGRTRWDKAIVGVCHPGAGYYHVDEALRPDFLVSARQWNPSTGKRLKLLSVGCSSFRKGPEVILRAAAILRKMGVDFEWNIVGAIPRYIQKSIEKKERLLFKENNVFFRGFKSAGEIIDMICDSTLYVHAAHMENSPNSICEAQIIGIPIISTNVGGIETLLQGSGALVPDNDSWMLANEIVSLAADSDRMLSYSTRGKEIAKNRHSPRSIVQQLLTCYKSVLEDRSIETE